MLNLLLFIVLLGVTGAVAQGPCAQGILGVQPKELDPSQFHASSRGFSKLVRGSSIQASQVSGSIIDVEYFAEVPLAITNLMGTVADKLNSLVMTRVSFNSIVDIPVNVVCGLPPIAKNITIYKTETLKSIRLYVGPLVSDGIGHVLAGASPCVTYVENGYRRAAFGYVLFDLADVKYTTDTARLTSTILHEVLHVLGIGSFWRERNLVGSLTSNPQYLGAHGIAAYAALLPINDTRKGSAVPVEDKGGAGTFGVHWRTSVFDNELMTGFLTGDTQPLSLLTAYALLDLGYEIDFNSPSIDDYVVPLSSGGFSPTKSPSSCKKIYGSLILYLIASLIAIQYGGEFMMQG